MDFLFGCIFMTSFFMVLAKIQDNKNYKTLIGKARIDISNYENSWEIKYLVEARNHLEKEIFRKKNRRI